MIEFKVFQGFAFRQTNGRTDICDCRVAFATEMSDLYLTHLIGIGNIENSTCGCFIHILTVCQKNVTLVDGFFVQLDITFVNYTQVCNQIK